MDPRYFKNYDEASGIPVGWFESVKTPWGTTEKANVVGMPTMTGKKEKYAVVMSKKNGKIISGSAFKVK
jgi:hypothetical protein